MVFHIQLGNQEIVNAQGDSTFTATEESSKILIQTHDDHVFDIRGIVYITGGVPVGQTVNKDYNLKTLQEQLRRK